jgi:hypothetical protein
VYVVARAAADDRRPTQYVAGIDPRLDAHLQAAAERDAP